MKGSKYINTRRKKHLWTSGELWTKGRIGVKGEVLGGEEEG